MNIENYINMCTLIVNVFAYVNLGWYYSVSADGTFFTWGSDGYI